MGSVLNDDGDTAIPAGKQHVLATVGSDLVWRITVWGYSI